MDRITRFLLVERPAGMWTWITGIALSFRPSAGRGLVQTEFRAQVVGVRYAGTTTAG
jgi:hypothetical protein